MTAQLELIDDLVARGRNEFTFDEAREVLGASPSATANTLRRLRDKGLVDRPSAGTTRSDRLDRSARRRRRRIWHLPSEARSRVVSTASVTSAR